jgi:branched-chain amino acid transport system permease protein
MDLRKHIPIAALAAVIVAVQAVMSASGADYFLIQLTMSAYYALVVLGLCLLMGYAGQISMGHAAFFALGGYITAVLSSASVTQLFGAETLAALTRWGLLIASSDIYGAAAYRAPSWLSLGLVIIITMAISYLIGIPVLRLKGHYLAMATLGFGTILYRIFLGTRVFGEADGISAVSPCVIAPGLAIGGDPGSRVFNYYFAWGLVALGMILLLNLINSRVGRALRSIHGNEEAAAAMGVDTARYKLNIFVLSAVFAAIGGYFMTHFNGGIGPSEAGIMKSVRYVAIVAVGGMANLWGCLVMGGVLNFLSLRGYFGSYDDAVFGAMLIIIMALAPDGIFRREILVKVKNTGRYLKWPFWK